MRKLTSRELVLLVAVLGLAILGWVYGRGAGLGGIGGSAEKLADLDYGEPPVVQLARLELEAVSYDSASRNLFSYYTPPPPPRPAPKPRVETKPPPTQAAPPRTVVRPPTPPPLAPKAPRPSFRYIGFLGPKDNKIAVFEKNNKREDEDPLLLARAGEILEERFQLEEINFQSVVLGYTEDRFKNRTTELSMRKESTSSSRGGGRRGRKR